MIITLRGFAFFVWCIGLYLSLVSTISLSELDSHSLNNHDESLPSERQLLSDSPHSRLARDVPFRNQQGVMKSHRKTPKLMQPPLHPLSPLITSESGPEEHTCNALREALLRPVALAVGKAMNSEKRVSPLSVLLVTSSWGLPPKVASASYSGKGSAMYSSADWHLLVRATEQNLQNPSVNAVHIFVPPSACVQQLAQEAEVANRIAQALGTGETILNPAGTRRKGRRNTQEITPLNETLMPESAAYGGAAAHGGTAANTVMGRARSPRLWLQLTSSPPTWASVLRHASHHVSTFTGATKQWVVVVTRADVAWPRSFGCLSAAAMRISESALTFSCQIHMRTCMEPKFMHGGASWKTAYQRCRASGRSVPLCTPMLDNCRKYAGVHHALAFAMPTSSPMLGALHALPVTFGSETRAAEALHSRLRPGSVSNACDLLTPICLRCTDFSEVQRAVQKGGDKHMMPKAVPKKLIDEDGSCDTLDTVIASENEATPVGTEF